MTASGTESIAAFVQDVPDFPKPGVVFKDITPLLADAAAFAQTIDKMSEPFLNQGIAAVAGIESRGFLLAGPIAYRLKAGLVIIRKKGKLPRKTVGVTYSLEYGSDTIEAHADAISPGTKVLVVDDVLATGGTAQAACELMERLGGKVAAATFLIELGFLSGRKKMGNRKIHSLLTY